MNTISKHFVLEVVVKLLHSQGVDKYASINKHDDAIDYTLKGTPKVQRHIGLQEAGRIFEDLYGNQANRWDSTLEFQQLQGRKNKAQARRTRKGRA